MAGRRRPSSKKNTNKIGMRSVPDLKILATTYYLSAIYVSGLISVFYS